MTAVNALACLLPTHKSWMKIHKHKHTHKYTNFDWPTFHPPSYADIQNIHTMMYCMNLRQVTPRLCRLCRQHCQIIPLICSIRIGKVYIQPQASNSNIILKLFSVKFTVSFCHTLVLSPKISPGSIGILSPYENIPRTFWACNAINANKQKRMSDAEKTSKV